MSNQPINSKANTNFSSTSGGQHDALLGLDAQHQAAQTLLQNNSLSAAQIAQLMNNYKLTPATLMSELCDWWTPAPFLQYLGAEIASAISRGGCGLLISAPPRHGKSKLITVATPLWTLENFPDKNIIVSTYGADLSTDFTREVKDIIKANQSKLSVRIRRDVDRAADFLTVEGGGLKAVGLRGTITGRGANVFILDDYIKEPKEALSNDYLESLKTWYATVARTRLEPDAVVIIVATRWVTNDLHGHIERLEMRRSRKFYRIIKIKAIAGKKDKDTGEWVEDPQLPDVLGRAPGLPLFPERYGREQLEDIIDELGARWFEAMFQQNPSDSESSVTNVQNLRFIGRKEYEEFLSGFSNTQQRRRFKRRRSWDLASTKEAGDFTAGVLATYDIETEKLYIENAIHGQFSAGRVEDVFSEAADLEANGGDHPDTEYILEQEPGSSGAYTTEHFKTLCPYRKLRVVKAASEGSKMLKAQPLIAATERHNVVFVVDDPADYSKVTWVNKWIDEFAVFPEGAHDDLMDASSSLYNDVTGKRPLGGAWGRSKSAAAIADRLKSRQEKELNNIGGFDVHGGRGGGAKTERALADEVPFRSGAGTWGRATDESRGRSSTKTTKTITDSKKLGIKVIR